MSETAAVTAPLTLRDFADIGVATLKGVGPVKAKALHSIGIDTVLDLLSTYPRRWVDRTNEARVADLRVGEEALVLVTVRRVSSRRTRNRRSLVEAVVGDGTGRMQITFFNQPWRERQLTPDLNVALFGKVDEFRGGLQMTNPIVDLIGDRTGRIVPIYPQSEKAQINTWEIAAWVEEALRRSAPRGISDPVPASIRERHDLVGRGEALHDIHLPDAMAVKHRARRRLAFDELLRVQLVLVRRKREIEANSVGISHHVEGELVRRFHAALPYELTGAQRRVIGEIAADLVSTQPMHRLLQGDVGSGKTVVALTALLAAVQTGAQGALMAPTEVLAEQHFAGVRALVEGLRVPADNLFGERQLRVELLTNRVTGAARKELLADLASGEIDIVIGTHALIQGAVGFHRLGVVVVDEQHRFGVEQRAALRDKAGAAVPDVLVMTATPIPRTAAMTVYGDLDVSVLDELPPGRTPIKTSIASAPLEVEGAWADVREEVAAGRQAYVVCPLIEESEKLEVASAVETYEELQGGHLYGLRLGLLHGRMASADKDDVMGRFRRGELDVLVATTVIEVGVDVPNATVMVILDAERFGIAQLHQLRGRVGRGGAESRCWLLSTPDEDGTISARVEAIKSTTDGFELAEIDLHLRGEGTIMNSAQKGRSDLRLASLRHDEELIRLAREAAFEIVDADPDLSGHPELADELELLFTEQDAEFLASS